MDHTVEVKIKSGSVEHCLRVRRGLGFQAIAKQHPDTPIEFDCRNADCGICIITVLEGREHLSDPTTREADFLKAMRAEPNERLACQVRVLGDVSVLVEDTGA